MFNTKPKVLRVVWGERVEIETLFSAHTMLRETEHFGFFLPLMKENGIQGEGRASPNRSGSYAPGIQPQSIVILGVFFCGCNTSIQKTAQIISVPLSSLSQIEHTHVTSHPLSPVQPLSPPRVVTALTSDALDWFCSFLNFL